MTVPVIRTWRVNPLSFLFKAANRNGGELQKVARRVFAPAFIMQIYSAPYHILEEQDELGQWADDGGPAE